MMNSGIQPTVELATNNGNGFAYPYPVMGGFGGGFGSGFGGNGALWLIILLALIWNNNSNRFFACNRWSNSNCSNANSHYKRW